MKRRKFVGFVLACLPSLALADKAVSSSGLQFDAPPSGASDVRNLLASLFIETENARAVGRQYLAAYPDRSGPEKFLYDRVVPALDLIGPDPARLRRYINELQRLDFAAGNTVTVGNYILSRAEADLCALASLS